MRERDYDVVIIGSGAGGGTVAQELAPLCRDGARIAVLEKGPRLRDDEFSGREVEMAQALYEDGGGFLTADGSMTLAMGCGYGGSTTVYTGTSIMASERVIRRWNVPGLGYAEIERRTHKFIVQNNVHYMEEERINENNRLFVQGCRHLGYKAQQFPVNVRGCRGSSLCNLGCPNQAKQGTNRVQLPRAERGGVEVVTRCEVVRLEGRAVVARVSPRPNAEKGEPSPWEPGEYTIRAKVVVVCAGAVHSPALLLRSRLPAKLPRLGHGFTCHPALILVAEHARAITNFVGHPKSYYLDEFIESDGFILETCMYFPFTTAKSLSGFGAAHSAFMRAFPRLQMILVLARDHVDRHNRVVIDGNGQPVVHYRFTPEVRSALARGTLTSSRIFFAAGAQRVHVPAAATPTVAREDADRLEEIVDESHFRPGGVTVSAAHLQGGCRMGLTAGDSVTDSFGRVHGVPWLFVADASLFPDSIEINPYLTIMALADRVAERIRRDAGPLLS
ncbi:MAG: GMC family oxidoreductase [Gemmatimonadota bacterium]|nr:MAG: GMC family oxidoreductase [Gemmatimonadota bacterium]